MDVFTICEFKTPAEGAVSGLKATLSAGMPVNVEISVLRSEDSQGNSSETTDHDPQATMLHVICSSVDSSDASQVELAGQLIDVLFEYGASWMVLDSQNKTPACICRERNLPRSVYDRFVKAGIRSEIFLQRMTDPDSDEECCPSIKENPGEHKEEDEVRAAQAVPEGNQKDYLKSKLTYTSDCSTLLTDQKDGVMMDWETPIMRRSAELIARPKQDGTGAKVLNIGFGLGIIDGFIQQHKPSKHYIIEAHPDVLRKMRQNGWYDKPNVTILEGTWRAILPKLLDEGVTFDGIYYDTFSEHYRDMLDLFDYVCGLLEFDGTFSFFNGLAADRQICYDVYKEVVELDLQDHGLEVKYEHFPVELPKDVWEGIKRSYFKVNSYALPVIKFMAS